MTFAELQLLARQKETEQQTLALEIEELRELGVQHRTKITQLKDEIAELRRTNARMRNQRAELVQCLVSTDEFRSWVIERVWVAGASDLDMAMQFIASRPEVKT